MPRDYSELRQRIRGKYRRMSEFATGLGITTGTLSNKLMGKSEWSRPEMEKAAELLDLTPDDILHIFFSF